PGDTTLTTTLTWRYYPHFASASNGQPVPVPGTINRPSDGGRRGWRGSNLVQRRGRHAPGRPNETRLAARGWPDARAPFSPLLGSSPGLPVPRIARRRGGQ